jgi:methionyl-tRNA synthetase
MLWSAGLPAPHRVFGHGFVTLKGEKMSKSRGIYVDPAKAVDEYGADAIRFFLVREIPFGQDGDFTWEAFVARYNADLANDLGNLLNRTLSLTARYFDGRIPPMGETTAQDDALAAFAEQCRAAYVERMDEYAIHTALEHATALVRATNRYVAETAPWTLAKNGNRERLGTVLYTALEATRWATVLVSPVMPDSAKRIFSQLGYEGVEGHDLASLEWGRLPVGQILGDIRPVFPRIELKSGETAEAAPVKPVEPVGETVPIEDFAKLDLRLALVLSAEPVPKSDKLLKLRVSLGNEERQIVAGIAQHYAPEAIVGKRIVIVANLAPRKVFGVESRGMLLAASDERGLCVAEFGRDIAPGAKVK